MVIIGKNVHIGSGAFFHTQGGLVIGNNTHISRNVTIYTVNHNYQGESLPFDETQIEKPVFIGENVWIGMDACILPGVSIGEGAIVGIGTVVSKNVDPYQVIGMGPHEFLNSRDFTHYEVRKKEFHFGGHNGARIEKDLYNEMGKNALDQGSDLIFIVGTGRCGTTTIAKFLSEFPRVVVKHEPNGQLIKLSTDYAHGAISKDEVKNRLRKMYGDASFMKGRIYGESDQKIANLIDVFHELFPNAKFIWLIRNAYDNVISMFSRGIFDDSEFNLQPRKSLNVERVYSPKVNSENRLNGYKAGSFSNEEWVKMSPFERNCWYWSFWNLLIESQLLNIPKKQWYFLKIEDLQNQQSNLLDFLGINENGGHVVKKMNSARYPLKSRKWSPSEEESFKKWCLPLNKRFYPDD
jgi:carbonic anhydrase/acetyltransferase-like protein (isoleucine patch superfamily)